MSRNSDESVPVDIRREVVAHDAAGVVDRATRRQECARKIEENKRSVFQPQISMLDPGCQTGRVRTRRPDNLAPIANVVTLGPGRARCIEAGESSTFALEEGMFDAGAVDVGARDVAPFVDAADNRARATRRRSAGSVDDGETAVRELYEAVADAADYVGTGDIPLAVDSEHDGQVGTRNVDRP